MPNLKVVILRGLPGSGKTTLFHQWYGNLEVGSVVHCSADSFFYQPVEEPKMMLTVGSDISPEAIDSFRKSWEEQIQSMDQPVVVEGATPVLAPVHHEYNFDPSLLPQAHTVCMGVFIEALKARRPYVVLDNTCSQLWEYRNYIALAQAFGYDVRVVSLPIPKSIEEAKILFDRQKHNVPLDIFLKMWWRWEPDPREEIVEVERPGDERS